VEDAEAEGEEVVEAGGALADEAGAEEELVAGGGGVGGGVLGGGDEGLGPAHRCVGLDDCQEAASSGR
jgi:hypothetical protein